MLCVQQWRLPCEIKNLQLNTLVVRCFLKKKKEEKRMLAYATSTHHPSPTPTSTTNTHGHSSHAANVKQNQRKNAPPRVFCWHFTTTSPALPMPSYFESIGLLWQGYKNNTPQRLKIIDVYLVYVLLTGIVLFAYCALVTTFPFNSFLAGFISTVGSFVLAGMPFYLLLYRVLLLYLVMVVCSCLREAT